jgi:Asp-tRNA(Asn)/Glu-tRNA(Gln) amidotransferase A subunit family amidase
VGIQLAARHGADAALIAVAARLEARLGLVFDRAIR